MNVYCSLFASSSIVSDCFGASTLSHMQIWLEMAAPPSEHDMGLLDTVLESWFVIGRLGGYNSMNLQATFLVTLGSRVHKSYHIDLMTCATTLPHLLHSLKLSRGAGGRGIRGADLCKLSCRLHT